MLKHISYVNKLTISVLTAVLCIHICVSAAHADILSPDCVHGVLESIVVPKNEVVASKLSIEKLASEIAARRARVPEFRFIAEEAKRRGLRAWLFGGTAAGYAHYVKLDVLRELGDPRFQLQHFDYDYTNIFRSTQDLDVVISGTAEQAKGFEQTLKERFPYFMGSKTTPWEVRSLTEDTNDKGGILDDFGFMNQHTDSHSTGMVELTEAPRDESVVRDVRDWKATNGAQFLKDVYSGELTIYYSPTHAQTPRAKEGKNPPIFFVTRALTKAFQYDLKLRSDQLEIFKKVIAEFNPKADLSNPDAARWMEKNGKKIYEHSADLETSRQVLDQLGLRKTLIKIKNNLNEEGSLAWVINRQPLETKPLGHGMGKTAKELGITVVSHETGSFLAYESIVRSNVGKPNVFISRPNTPGEVAVYGPRFYTAKGDQGARRTGITIRFTVDPNARDGWDFDLTEIRYERDGKIADGTHVNFQNRAALTVIPESINMTPSGYFRFLAENKSISADDKAILWKFKCKLDNSFISGQISSNELQAIREVVLEQLKKNTLGPNVVLEEWIRLEGKLLKKDSKDIERLIQTLRSKTYEADPGTFFIMMTEIAKNTSLEHYVTQEWLPTLISFETSQPDIGDRAIHNSLFSNHLVLRKIGAKALLARKTMTPYVRALRGVFGQNGDAIAWLKLEANTFEEIEERAAYLALHPELKGALTSELKKSVEPILNDISNIKIYENLAGGHLSPSASPESFKFVSFDFPVGGKLLQLGGNESPHEVILAKSFQIQATPVTQRQWQLVMNNNPSYFQATDELNLDRPVESISWQETQQFIEKLNKLDDKYIYRLPTEAEWEYAAGRDRKYELVRYDAYLWHSGNSDEQTHRVASLKPNEYEIYDVYGNVRQWLQDWFDFYPGGQPVDPSGPAFGSTRVYRGTDWSSSAIFSPAKRGWGAFPSMRSNAYGFRLVRTKK